MQKKKHFLIIILTFFILIIPVASLPQTVEIAGKITNPEIKMDGVAWDGKNIWVITYRSSPIEWKIAQLDDNGDILTSFHVPVNSLDDIHNFGMTNITSDGKTIWANHWNEGIIYRFTKKGKIFSLSIL